MPTRRPRPSPETAHKFLKALDFEGSADTPQWFQTYDESGQERPSLIHSLYGSFNDHVRELLTLNKAGAGIHFLVNVSDGKAKVNENIVAPRACFADFDHVEPDIKAFPVAPSIVVRSAHGPHVYWLLAQGEDLSRWAHLQLLLAEALEADLKTRKLTRLQRLPGFLHRKGEPVPVPMEPLAEPLTRFTIDHLAAAWGLVDRLKEAEQVEADRRKRVEARRAAPAPGPRANGLSPLERARAYIDRVPGAPEGDRNDHTSKHVASAGYDFGVDREVWIGEVLNWNNSHNNPPLPEREVVAIVRSTYKSLERKSTDAPGWKLNQDSDEWKEKQRQKAARQADRQAEDEARWNATLDSEPTVSPPKGTKDGGGDYDTHRERRRAADMRVAMESGIQALLSDDLLSLPCDATPGSVDGFPITTRGNAMRVIADHKPTLRHCPPTSQWYWWDGMRWKTDEAGHIYSLVQKRIAGMHAMLTSKRVTVFKDDDDETKKKKLGLKEAIWKHILKSERASAIKEVVELTSWQPTIKVMPKQLDADNNLVNTQSGVVFTPKLQQGPHDPGQYHTLVTTAPFDAKAECPNWLSFLTWAMCGDVQLVEFLQRAVGYSATGWTREQVFFLCYGNGGNGKSTFLTTVLEILGDYGTQCDIELFLQSPAQRGSSPNEELLALRGVRMVYAFEPTEGRALAESRIKQITGGEKITARPLYGRPVTFSPNFSLWLSTNHRPVIRGTDDGIWRRVLLIPWKAKITDDEKDDGLHEKLLKEAPGILRWMLEGAWKWHEAGLEIPDQVRAETASYRDEMDLLGAFLEQCCTTDENHTAQSSDLYGVFRAWCERQGERAWKQKTLKERLRERGIECVKRRGIMTFVGIGVLEAARPDPQIPGTDRKDVYG
jgi:putative DNA primase/helicase